MPVQVTLSAAWRDAAGRFASKPVAGALDAGLPQLARNLVMKLQSATPVRSGQMKANWTQVYVPSQKQIRIANRMPYWTYVALTGTEHMEPNPELQAVIADAPADLKVTVDAVGRQIVTSLTGG